MHFHGRVGRWLRILAPMCVLRLPFILQPVSLPFYDHCRSYGFERQEGKFRLGLRANFPLRNMLRKDTEAGYGPEQWCQRPLRSEAAPSWFNTDTHRPGVSQYASFHRARVLEGADSFKSALKGDLHFCKPLPCGGIDFRQPPSRLLRGMSLHFRVTRGKKSRCLN
jgi:hypothetical protein